MLKTTKRSKGKWCSYTRSFTYKGCWQGRMILEIFSKVLGRHRSAEVLPAAGNVGLEFTKRPRGWCQFGIPSWVSGNEARQCMDSEMWSCRPSTFKVRAKESLRRPLRVASAIGGTHGDRTWTWREYEAAGCFPAVDELSPWTCKRTGLVAFAWFWFSGINGVEAR